MYIFRSPTKMQHSHYEEKAANSRMNKRKLYWLLRIKILMAVPNKILLHKVIIKPIWTYDIHIWGTS